MLNPTPAEFLVDSKFRPYFLWDEDTTLAEFRARLRSPDPDTRAHMIGKLMRQAKPDDAFLFVRPDEIAAMWPRLGPYLGRSYVLWTWFFDTWEELGLVYR